MSETDSKRRLAGSGTLEEPSSLSRSACPPAKLLARLQPASVAAARCPFRGASRCFSSFGWCVVVSVVAFVVVSVVAVVGVVVVEVVVSVCVGLRVVCVLGIALLCGVEA